VFAAFGPAGTGALRFAAAALVLGAVVRPRLRGRRAGAWRAIVALGVATCSVLVSLDPAIAGLVGLPLLGQHLEPGVVAGMALVIGAVLSRPRA
jgi:inner membrane transporter RhtA